MSERELHRRLRAHGFELSRQRKHLVYKNPAGLTFVVPSTPSDQRWSANALADLARLCGPAETDSRPLRARRQHGRLEPHLSAVEEAQAKGEVQQPAESPTPAPAAPLSRADQQRLRRWEKHESQRGAKDERRLAKLRDLAHRAHESLERSSAQRGALIVRLTLDTYRRVRQLGFQDVALSVANVGRNAFAAVAIVIRVGGRFIDIIEGVVREGPTWEDAVGTMVEVWADMHPDDFREFDGEEMYLGPAYVSSSIYNLELKIPDGRTAELALFHALLSYAEGTPVVIFLSDGSLLHGEETLKAAATGTDPNAECTVIEPGGDADELFRAVDGPDCDWPEMLEAARQNCMEHREPSESYVEWLRVEIAKREDETKAA